MPEPAVRMAGAALVGALVAVLVIWALALAVGPVAPPRVIPTPLPSIHVP